MSIKPKVILNESITGNVRLKHIQATNFITFLTSQSEKNFIVTETGKDNKEHLHFFIESLNIKLETFKKNLRTKFPELKSNIKGGAHKYNVKYIKEKIQYYYLFKESNETHFQFLSNYYNISLKYIEKKQKKYLKLSHINSLGAAGKFYQYCIENNICLTSTKSLITAYIKYSVTKNRKLITSFDCEKHINYILARESPTILIENWKLKFNY